MSDPIQEFFDDINEQGFDARLGRVRGTIRFEVHDQRRAEQWLVSLDRGAIHVSHDEGPADCVVRTDRATLDGIVAGQINPTAALVRGVMAATGDIDVLLHLQRLFPARPDGQVRNVPAAAGEAS